MTACLFFTLVCAGLNDEQYNKFLTRSQEVTHPLAAGRGSLPQPEDVSDLIVFLVSDKAKWITGDTVKIDAGRTCLGAR
jgi:NAD(P)-dependent dehydrogenase (short-subunit alcohol dehydrogenase family)